MCYSWAYTATDLVTNNARDLYLIDDDKADNDETATTTTGSAMKSNNDPRRHHLQHGFSVVLNILSPSTAQALQQYILQQKCIFDDDDDQGRLYGRTTRTGSWRSGRYDLLWAAEFL
ncbi:hypothetical protein ACA910_016362 [Epithemia clementina (nom. ined.)]